jgi:hypothetical protein
MVAVTRSTPLIVLWAAPRSRSTAFVRMMMERGDLLVVHEPFSNLAAVGHVELAGVSAHSEKELFDLLFAQARDTGRRVFVKETTDYRYDAVLADARLYTGVTSTFMIRDPAAVVASHHAMNPQVARDEIGFERLAEMFEAVHRGTGAPPVVIDGDDLVTDPAGIVSAFCRRTGLAFRPEALGWSPQRRPEWDRTRAWHTDVETSTGFTTTARRHEVRPDNDARLAELAAYHRPFYERLSQYRIRPTARGAAR